jgi:hypothetical protein
MKNRSMKRALIVAMLSAATVVLIDGCTAVKKMSPAQPAGAEPASKKDYNWQDMSTGKSFFRPINPPTQQ